MNYKKSPLNFKSFIVFESHFKNKLDKDKECNFEETLLEIEYDILIAKQQNDLFKLLVKINGEPKEAVNGYKFSVFAGGIFLLTNLDELGEDKRNQFLLYSALPMLISSIRNYIMNITSYAQFGKYILPAIDLKKLIDSKHQDLDEN